MKKKRRRGRPGLSKSERSEIYKQIRQNMDEIKKRVTELRQNSVPFSYEREFSENQLTKFKTLTKTKRDFSTGNLTKMNKGQLKAILRQQNLFLKSKWSTQAGREEVAQKQFETMTQKKSYTITAEQAQNMRDLFASRRIRDMIAEHIVNSDEIVDWAEQNVTVDDVEYYFSNVIFKKLDYRSMSQTEILEVLTDLLTGMSEEEVAQTALYQDYVLDEYADEYSNGDGFYYEESSDNDSLY